jgi:hypothetical protein
MGRNHYQDKPLETIWEISDELWERIEPIFWKDTPAETESAWRSSSDRLAIGSQWNHLPTPLRMPVEQTSQTVWRPQFGSPLVSAVEPQWHDRASPGSVG